MTTKPKKDEITLAWFAGFYEGEGWICNDKSNNNRLRLGINQNDPTPLNTAKELWGCGSVLPRTRISAKGKECHGHVWRISHNDALQFISDIRPYMRIPYKIQQIDQCLKVLKVKDTRRYKCKYCDKDYANPSGRRRHEKQEHSNIPEVQPGASSQSEKIKAGLQRSVSNLTAK